MKASFLGALFALSVSAQDYSLPAVGFKSPGLEDSQIFEDAGRKPNSTNSVRFTRTYNNTEETWDWRINVTELAVPDKVTDLGKESANFSRGLHVTNTQWQLGWPGTYDSLDRLLKDRNATFSLATLVTTNPIKNTDRYKDEDNGNCMTLLGDQCVQSIKEAALRSTHIIFSNLEGCETAFEGGGDLSAVSMQTSPNNSTFHRDDSLFYHTSHTYAAGNSTLFDQWKSALQLFVMNFNYTSSELGNTSGASVLCRVVDNKSAAVGWRQSTVAVWGIVLFSTLVIM